MPWINGKNDRSTADENRLQAEVAVELSGSYYGNRRIIAKFSLIYQYFLADRVDLVLLIFGLAALAGIWVTGKLVDHFLRLTVLASLALFGLITLIFALDAQAAIVIYAGTAVWGLTFGGAATLLQTALADAAGASADTALAMNVVAWNGAIAAGGIAGGFMLETWGGNSISLGHVCVNIGWIHAGMVSTCVRLSRRKEMLRSSGIEVARRCSSMSAARSSSLLHPKAGGITS